MKPLLLFTFMILVSCEVPIKKDINQFSDEILVKIYDWADRQVSDSLIHYFNEANRDHTCAAVLAFASIQDTTAIQPMIKLFTRTDAEVRAAAAYSLGQYRSDELTDDFINQIKIETNEKVLRNLYEALGKTGSEKALEFINYSTEHPVATSWGLYRLAASGKMDLHGIEKAIELLSHDSVSTRIAAAHTLARSRNFDLTSYQDRLFPLWKNEKSPSVLIPLTRSFGEITSSNKAAILTNIFTTSEDPLLITEGIRVANPEDFWQISALVFQLLNHKNAQVWTQAVSYLKEVNPDELPIADLTTFAESITDNAYLRIAIWELILTSSSNKEFGSKKVIGEFETSEDRYIKLSCLAAISHDSGEEDYLKNIIAFNEDIVVRTKAYEVLLAATSGQNLKPLIKHGLESEDIGMICTASMRLQSDTSLLGDSVIVTALTRAKQNLILPKETEALVEIDRTLNLMDPNILFPPKVEWNHPINWEVVKKIPQNQKVEMLTSQGKIILELRVNEAPGTVASFIELVNQGYYNGKNFHRLVPNFVIQGGCPRGDGWGSLDFTLRSELSNLKYTPGAVGVASAGKDTEGCQFFITHEHTPHLDGRYTIFANVIEGMEVVNQLNVGDKIEYIRYVQQESQY